MIVKGNNMNKKKLSVVALLTVRNEERYIKKCLMNLYSQGIDTCLIDNDSTDRTVEIAKNFLNKGLIRIEHLPYSGAFELGKILRNEERLANEIEADWFMHHDADEIREAPKPYKTLIEGIEDADTQGYNAINFDEFVFLPTDDSESFEGKDYVKKMKYYYFFEPRSFHRLNAWKKNKNIDLYTSGGHQIKFNNMKVFPKSFILRHYIVLSRPHVLGKFAGRIYSQSDTDMGWSYSRLFFSPDKLNFPSRKRLKKIDASGKWDKSEPWKTHDFLRENRKKYSKHISNTIENTQMNDANKYNPMPMIIGAPRSGTTLLRLMLDAHPELAIPPETHFIPSLLKLNREDPQLRQNFYKKITEDIRWQDFHLPLEDFLDRLEIVQPFTIADGLRCFYKMYAKRFKKIRWGDKTPPYVLYIRDIQKILPEAYFIHIIRDGRDVALSMRDMWWGPGDDMESQAAHWLWRVREGRHQGQYCKHYLEVRFEELVANPIKTLQKICSFIDLPYNEAMLNYYKKARERLMELGNQKNPDSDYITTAEKRISIFHKTESPPDISRLGRWKKEMNRQDIIKFESVAKDMLRDLEYETGNIRKKNLLTNFLSGIRG